MAGAHFSGRFFSNFHPSKFLLPMSTSVFFLILAAALFHACWNIIVKGGDNKLYEIAMNALGGGMGALFILPFTPWPGSSCLPMLALSCLTHIIYYFFLASTYKVADLGLAYTVMRGSAPIITALTLWLFGVPLGLSGWIGLLLLCFGILSLALGQNSNIKGNIKGILYALRTSVIIMCYTLADGFGARAATDSLSYTCWLYVINIFPIQIWVLTRHGKNYLGYLRVRGVKGISGGLCGLASYGIAIWAMTKAPIALVEALRETAVIFGIFLAAIFLGEKLTIRRIVAAILVTSGAIVVKLA